nr:hypothetical protein [Streptomyces cahuitamycinicus]
MDLSEGQWQELALARALMRAAPLLFVLDKPTAFSTPRADMSSSSVTWNAPASSRPAASP